METKVFCVYNVARRVVLSSKVTVADSVNEPLTILKVLVGGLAMDSASGLWLSPVHGVPSVPRLFPFDILYLDRDLRILDQAEFVPGGEFPPFSSEVASALILPSRSLRTSQTEPGDRFLICAADELERKISLLGNEEAAPVHVIAMQNGHRGGFASQHADSALKQGSGSPPAASSAAVAVTEEELKASGVNLAAVESEVVAAAPLREAVKESASEKKGKPQGKTPVMSITEVILERPRTEGAARIAGFQDEVEDPFSSWMDRPTLASAWKAGREPVRQQMDAPAASPVEVPSPEPIMEAATAKNSGDSASATQAEPLEIGPRGRIEPIAMDAAVNQAKMHLSEPSAADAEAARAEALQEVSPSKSELKLSKSGEPEFDPLPSQPEPRSTPEPRLVDKAPVSTPVRVALPQPAQATTSTVAHYGLWRASLPTAVIAVAGEKKPQARSEGSIASGAPQRDSAESNAISTDSPVVSNDAKTTPGAAAEAVVRERVEEPARVSGDVQVSSLQVQTKFAIQPAKPVNQAAVPATRDKSAVPTLPAEPAAERVPAKQSAAASAQVADAVDIVQRKLGIGQANIPDGTSTPKDKKTPVPVRKAAPAAPAQPVKLVAEPVAKKELFVRGNGSPSSIESSNVAQIERPQTPATRAETNGDTPNPAPTLADRFKRWLNPAPAVKRGDRRRAHRRYVPGMVAHYYTGGAPKPHEVADISMTGFYLLTEDRWMPDTMIQMTLQKPCAKGERKQSITVLSRVVRRGSDGVAAQFVMADGLDPQSRDVQPSLTTDRFALARFI